MTALSPEARQVLLGMKERLTAGWTQGRLVDSREIGEATARCLVGSGVEIAVARGDAELITAEPGRMFSGGAIRGGDYRSYYVITHESPTGEALLALARALDVTCGSGLAAWNDAPERTHADVVSLIDRVLLNDVIATKVAPDRAREEVTA